MNFQSRDSQSSPLFQFNHIIKFEDKIHVEDILLTSKSINNLLPPIFNDWFTLYADIRNYGKI